MGSILWEVSGYIPPKTLGGTISQVPSRFLLLVVGYVYNAVIAQPLRVTILSSGRFVMLLTVPITSQTELHKF